MRKLKRFLSLCLTLILCCTVNANESMAADYGTTVNVSMNIRSTYKVGVPYELSITGVKVYNSKTITVEGDIAGTDEVVIEIPDTMVFKSKNKDDITADLSLSQDRFTHTDLANGVICTPTLTIDASDATAGNWNGSFSIKVYLDSDDVSNDVPTELAAGLYNKQGTLLCAWEASGIGDDCSNASTILDKEEYAEVTKVVIPDGTTTIGSSAFSYNTSLETVIIPDSVTTIESRAFEECKYLTTLIIPDTVTSIGYNAFRYVPHIVYNGTAVDTETEYGLWGAQSINGYVDGVFVYEDNSKTTLLRYAGTDVDVTIPGTVTAIGNNAFRNYQKLNSVVIPDSVTSIGEYSFAYCNSITNIEIPESVVSIGESAFYGCRSLTSIELPSGVTVIENGTFRECDNLESVTISGNIVSIGEYAFYSDNNLTNITIPDGVTTIGSNAFIFCENLTDLVIPDSVTTIGEDAFTNVPHITYNGPCTEGSPWGALSIN